MKKQRITPLALCGYCAEKAVMTDATGRMWCATHRYRGDLLNEGARHRYPAVHVHPYAIAAGAYFWGIFACAGREACVKEVLTALTTMEEGRASA